eukprot:365725-Chlamydomonas_euryale.AAC.22
MACMDASSELHMRVMGARAERSLPTDAIFGGRTEGYATPTLSPQQCAAAEGGRPHTAHSCGGENPSRPSRHGGSTWAQVGNATDSTPAWCWRV